MSELIRFDWAIRYLLRDKVNFDILEGFLNAMIGEEVDIQELLECEDPGDGENFELNRIDMVVQNQKDENIFIMLQVDPEQDVFHHLAYGLPKQIDEYLKSGKLHSNITKVVSITLSYFHSYFEVGEGNDYLYRSETTFVGMNENDLVELTTRQSVLSRGKKVSQIFPEHYLLRVNKFENQINCERDEWIYMLKNCHIMPSFQAGNIQEAGNKLSYMKLNKQERLAYNRHMENMRYRASMEHTYQVKMEEKFEQGRKLGEQKAQQYLIRNAL